MRHNLIVPSELNLQHMRVCDQCGLVWDTRNHRSYNSDAKCPNTKHWRTAFRRLFPQMCVVLHTGPAVKRWQEYIGGSIFPENNQGEIMKFPGVIAVRVVVGTDSDNIILFDQFSVTAIEGWRDIRRMTRFPDDHFEIYEKYDGEILQT